MWQHLLLTLPLIISVAAIKVQVDYNKEDATEIAPTEAADPTEKTLHNNPIYYASNDEVDSYLVPPDPNKPVEVLSDVYGTPATYLLPPSPETVQPYYAPVEPSSQSDWYPIAKVKPSRPQANDVPIFLIGNQSDTFDPVDNVRKGKVQDADRSVIQIPSSELEPPKQSAPRDYLIPIPSDELQLPLVDQPYNIAIPENYPLPTLKPIKKKYNPLLTSTVPLKFQLQPAEPTLALHLTPPQPLLTKYKNPTKLYPKKYAGGFKPIPIPIAQYAEDSLLEVPTAKPVNLVKPAQNDETDYLIPIDEKKVYIYEQAEQKRKLKEDQEAVQEQQVNPPTQESYEDSLRTEQDASETNYRHPGRNVYPAPMQQAPPVAPQDEHAPPPNGERTEFRMHGMKGPHSYQFGYDTGKGKNRQFRYEERDNDGHVRGHYGYMDKHGKLRVVNYDAHPQFGFHAEAPVDKL